MTPKLPRIGVRRLERALRQAGFSPLRQTGSHRRWAHPDGRRVVVPVHSGKALPTGTLAAIVKQAKLDPSTLSSR